MLDFVKKDGGFLPFIFISVEEAGGGGGVGGGREVGEEGAEGGGEEEAMSLNWHGCTLAIKAQSFVSVSTFYEDMSTWVLVRKDKNEVIRVFLNKSSSSMH